MLEQPTGVLLYVTDLDLAKSWYSRALEALPAFVSDDMVCFQIGGCELTLCKAPLVRAGAGRVYWSVNDVALEYRRITGHALENLQLASACEVGTHMAEVTDPFGNILGLRAKGWQRTRNEARAEAVKSALLGVRSTVDAFEASEQAQKRTSRKVFLLAASLFAALLLYFAVSLKPAIPVRELGPVSPSLIKQKAQENQLSNKQPLTP